MKPALLILLGALLASPTCFGVAPARPAKAYSGDDAVRALERMARSLERMEKCR